MANELASKFKAMQRPQSESASPLSDSAKKKRGKRNETNLCSGVKVSTSGVKSTPSPKQGKRKNGGSALVGRSPTSAGERSGNKPIPGFVPCCNVRCSPIRLKCG